MKGAALGLILGLAAGGISQWMTWRAVYRIRPAKKNAAEIARHLGGFAARLTLDALTLYAGWMLTRSLWGIVATAAGILVAMGVSTLWQYRNLRKK